MDEATKTSHALLEVLRLVPPHSSEFKIYGGADTVERARQWALDREYLLARDVVTCAHGLYGMAMCPRNSCRSAAPDLDHVEIWVPQVVYNNSDRETPFMLLHPYQPAASPELLHYAESHGLVIDSRPDDGWYGTGATPIRLSVPSGWPLWPIERLSILLQYTQPTAWPDTDRA